MGLVVEFTPEPLTIAPLATTATDQAAPQPDIFAALLAALEAPTETFEPPAEEPAQHAVSAGKPSRAGQLDALLALVFVQPAPAPVPLHPADAAAPTESGLDQPTPSTPPPAALNHVSGSPGDEQAPLPGELSLADAGPTPAPAPSAESPAPVDPVPHDAPRLPAAARNPLIAGESPPLGLDPAASSTPPSAAEGLPPHANSRAVRIVGSAPSASLAAPTDSAAGAPRPARPAGATPSPSQPPAATVAPAAPADRPTGAEPAPVESPAGPALPLPERIENLDAVASAVFEAVEDGGGTARLHLEPDGLGEITIRLHARHEAVHLDIHADTPEAVILLRDAAADLSSLLGERGMNLGGLNIGLGTRDSGTADAREGRSRGPRPAEGEFAAILGLEDPAAAARHLRLRAAYNPDGSLLYRV